MVRDVAAEVLLYSSTADCFRRTGPPFLLAVDDVGFFPLPFDMSKRARVVASGFSCSATLFTKITVSS